LVSGVEGLSCSVSGPSGEPPREMESSTRGVLQGPPPREREMGEKPLQ
jgi:hypothetical protein